MEFPMSTEQGNFYEVPKEENGLQHPEVENLLQEKKEEDEEDEKHIGHGGDLLHSEKMSTYVPSPTKRGRKKREPKEDEDFVPVPRSRSSSKIQTASAPRAFPANNTYRGYDPITGMPQSNTARATAYLGPATDGYMDLSHVKGVYKNCRGIWAAQWTDEKGQRHTKYFNPKFFPTENEARVSALKFKQSIMQEIEMKGGPRKARASRNTADRYDRRFNYMYNTDPVAYNNMLRQQQAAYHMNWANMAAVQMAQTQQKDATVANWVSSADSSYSPPFCSQQMANQYAQYFYGHAANGMNPQSMMSQFNQLASDGSPEDSSGLVDGTVPSTIPDATFAQQPQIDHVHESPDCAPENHLSESHLSGEPEEEGQQTSTESNLPEDSQEPPAACVE